MSTVVQKKRVFQVLIMLNSVSCLLFWRVYLWFIICAFKSIKGTAFNKVNFQHVVFCIINVEKLAVNQRRMTI